MKIQIRLAVATLLVTTSFSIQAQAWGRRGHSIICQTAAVVLAAKTPDGSADFLKKHSFDLGFYCNVPDLIWKKPATYDLEHPQHFMDLEIFERAFKAAAVTDDPFAMSRLDFEKKYPSIDAKAGRSYWRIQELVASLAGEVQILKQPTVPQAPLDERAKHQENWLVTAGVIGHYVGDLSQPLHVTENYDGSMTNQKGIHSYFEDAVVDQLSSTNRPAFLEAAVGRDALAHWATFHKQAASRTVLQLIEELARASQTNLPLLLKLDRSVGRSNIKKAGEAYLPMIQSSMMMGALTLAEIWSRELEWTYNGAQFYNFNAAPDYVYVPGAGPVAASAAPTRTTSSTSLSSSPSTSQPKH